MLTRLVFSALWALVVVQRLWETRVSKAHERLLFRDGATEHARWQMPWMIALHAAWLIATLLEVWLLARPFTLALAVPALLLFALGQSLRLVAMRTLGARWTVRIVTPAHANPPITQGVYRHLRHPNYVGVALEIFALPLLHGAYLSALIFSVLNALLLRARIRAEEQALSSTSAYAMAFAGRPRFIPDRLRP
jgi:methyltransferase